MDACSLCCNESQSWAVGPCEHATCLVCSVRLRVLCDQRDCPVCREKLNKVRVASVRGSLYCIYCRGGTAAVLLFGAFVPRPPPRTYCSCYYCQQYRDLGV